MSRRGGCCGGAHGEVRVLRRQVSMWWVLWWVCRGSVLRRSRLVCRAGGGAGRVGRGLAQPRRRGPVRYPSCAPSLHAEGGGEQAEWDDPPAPLACAQRGRGVYGWVGVVQPVKPTMGAVQAEWGAVGRGNRGPRLAHRGGGHGNCYVSFMFGIVLCLRRVIRTYASPLSLSAVSSHNV